MERFRLLHKISGIYKKNTTVCRMRQEDFEKFVMQNRKKYDAFNLSAAFIGCSLLSSASEHDPNDPPYQAAANNVKIHCQRPVKAGGRQLPLCAQLQLSAHPSGRIEHPAPCYQCDAA